MKENQFKLNTLHFSAIRKFSGTTMPAEVLAEALLAAAIEAVEANRGWVRLPLKLNLVCHEPVAIAVPRFEMN